VTATRSPDEVIAYLADHAKPTTCEVDVRARIAACDTNNDGRIDFSEVSRSIDRGDANIVVLPQRGRGRKSSRFTERA
jgi:hypothetical protein